MEPIAVVGFAFRLPQDSNDYESFWEVLQRGKNLMTEWPSDRINISGFYDANAPSKGQLRAKGGHFLSEDLSAFDAPFFSTTAKEAAAMDPRQRLMLETSYLALENAGMPLKSVSGTQTAVFEASMTDDYNQIVLADLDTIPQTAATSTAQAIIANRVSWFFNLLGPSIHVDTACSGSLVAVDLACSSLRNGDSSMALVAGSNLMLSPQGSLMLSKMNFLSPDSLCYSFDSRANGYARGEGMIVMVLKRLTDAVNHGDTIRAIIRSSGTNQDGHTPGLTQPSSESQENLIRAVYQKAGLDMSLTRYVEAHGTGTPIGDPLEIKAIGRAFKRARSYTGPLYVGSVKANVGHLEGGSGLAGLLKSIMMLEKGQIPPNALLEAVNPELNLESHNIKIPTSLSPWPCDGLRRISVNSFGFGGTNAHVVLDDAFHYLESAGLQGHHRTSREHPAPFERLEHIHQLSDSLSEDAFMPIRATNDVNVAVQKHLLADHLPDTASDSTPSQTTEKVEGSEPEDCSENMDQEKPYLLVWSATDENAIKRVMKQASPYIENVIHGDVMQLSRFAYTLSERRSRFLWKCYALSDPRGFDGKTHLVASKPQRSTSQQGISFVFTGQGAEYKQMGLGLLDFPIFKRTLQQMDRVLADLGCEWSLLEKLSGSEDINQPQFSQPLCTALQISLVELLKTLNVLPVSVVGHSSGEIAAAYSTGALSMASACRVAYYRGKFASQMKESCSTPGAMMSTNLPSDQVEGYIQQKLGEQNPPLDITVACINSPTNVTLSGGEAGIDLLKQQLDADGIFAHKLNTGIAYHSPSMRAVEKEYERSLNSLEPGTKPSYPISMVSSVTGQSTDQAILQDPTYWTRNLLSPVQFFNAITTTIVRNQQESQKQPIVDLVEIGPHPALRRSCLDILGYHQRDKHIRYASALSRNYSARDSVLELIGKLFTYGYDVSVTEANFPRGTKKLSSISMIDTPPYPFDDSQTHWHESRLSRNFRLREPVRKEVLGVRSNDWNPSKPRWRKLLSSQSMPWLADHVVSGNCVLPGTGMLITALEAVRESVPANEKLKAFFVKEAIFASPIQLRENASADKEAEMVIGLVPLYKSQGKSSKWFEVWIDSYDDGSWAECFRGTIQAQFDGAPGPIDGGKESIETQKSILETYNDAKSICSRRIPSGTFYAYCAERGVEYGPSFRILENMCWGENGTATAEVNVSRPVAEYEGLVHPAILDAACQLCWFATSRGMSQRLPTEVPHKLQNTWLAASGWKHPQTSNIRISSRAAFKPSGKGIRGNLIIVAEDGAVLGQVQRMELSQVADGGSHESTHRQLLHGISWKPCLSLTNAAEINVLCNKVITPDRTSSVADLRQLYHAIRMTVMGTIAQLSQRDRDAAPEHLKKYTAWMERMKLEGENDERVSAESLDRLWTEIENSHPSWAVFVAIARDHLSLIRGDSDSLQTIFSNDLAERYYADVFQQICDDRLASYLDLASHEKPTMSILEVGAGTGSMTEYVLQALDELEAADGGTRYSEFVYTDISPGFFDDAQTKFRRFQSRLDFKTLDLEKDVVQQGFKEASFDLVIAGCVLHTTANLRATLENIRKLMKPGGKLIFVEIVHPAPSLQFSFGLLPGWWLGSEEWRNGNQDQCTTEQQWHDLLIKTGFSGNDLAINTFKKLEHEPFSIIASTATTISDGSREGQRVMFCVDETSTLQPAIATAVQSGLLSAPNNCETFPLSNIDSVTISSEDVVIVLCDAEGSHLNSLGETDLLRLQKLLQKAKNLIWVGSNGTHGDHGPFAEMALGFLRTLRSEATNNIIVTLLLDEIHTDIEAASRQVVNVFEATFIRSSIETEYSVQNGKITIARLAQEQILNKKVLSAVYPERSSEPWGKGPPVMLNVGVLGSLDSLQFVLDPIYQTPLGEEEVEIEAKAWGLNFRDVFVSLGQLDEKELGLDVAGYVTRVGNKCSSFKPGDRVLMAKLGSMRMYPRALEMEVIKLPDSINFEDAASLPTPAMTAIHCLVNVARLQKGEKILIHSAAGATGQLAVQMAYNIGAEIFITVGNEDKKNLALEFGIPEDHIFYSRDTSFAQGICRVTKGYGVDVVLNSLSGEGLRASWECMAPFGRFVEIGKADIKGNSGLPMIGFERNVSFSAVDLCHVAEVRKDFVKNSLDAMMKMHLAGEIQCPYPRHVYKVSSIEDAFRFMQSGKNIGRIIITNDSSDIVPKLLTHERSYKFDANGSYLIAGGLGGIGRAICRWLVSRGAKNLILPSRSGPSSQAASELVTELKSKGVIVQTPLCDVSSLESLTTVLDDCAKTMPPIRGCINAAMVLQDSIFEIMTHAQWDTTIRSKVHTSWNLHNLLPRNLDFFILLSSLSGIYGNASQANYAAGNTFQDSLAKYRTSIGEKGVSINLGWMRTIGIISESEDYQNFRTQRSDMAKIEEEELLSLLSIYCDTDAKDTPQLPSQILFGAVTPADSRKNGIKVSDAMSRSLFSTMSGQTGSTLVVEEGEGADVATFFLQAKDPSDQEAIAAEALVKKLARSLSMSPDDIDRGKALFEYGVDSLVAVELRNWIGKTFAAEVAVFDIMGGTTIAAVGALVAKRTTLERK